MSVVVSPVVLNAPVDASPDPRQYEIRARDGRVVRAFVAWPEPWEPGRSADEVAITEGVAWSATHDGRFVVIWIPPDGDPVELALVRDCVGTYLVDPDAAAADSHYGRSLTPAGRARVASSIRRHLEAPTAWGEAS